MNYLSTTQQPYVYNHSNLRCFQKGGQGSEKKFSTTSTRSLIITKPDP